MSKKIVKNGTAEVNATAATAATGSTRGRKPGGKNFQPLKIADLAAMVGSHTDIDIQVSTKWVKTVKELFPVSAKAPASEPAEFSVQ